MPAFDWSAFLQAWNQTILADPDLATAGLPPHIVAEGWLGYPGATEPQIAATEARLGVRLPPSYRAFLSVSNGWAFTGGFAGRLLPVEEIDWFRAHHQDWIDAWTAGSSHDLFGQAAAPPRPPEPGEADYSHLADTLAVSEAGDGAIFLLNPRVTGPDGEWEAWFFADWNPGAAPYESFWEMMQAQVESQRLINVTQARQVKPGDPPQALVDKLPLLLEAIRDQIADFRRLSLSKAEQVGAAQHTQGMLEGLSEVESGVVALLGAGIEEPEAVRAQLRALVDQLEADAQQLEAQVKSASQDDLALLFNPAKLLASFSSSIARMMQGIQTGGKAQGMRQGASVIRWYLNEQR
jgi:hypothetical protein